MAEQFIECDDQQLMLAIRGDDNELPEPLAHHVEKCTRCQNRLSELAATEDRWQKAASALTGSKEGLQSIHSGSFPQGFERWGEQSLVWNESMVKQLLDPPTHPEMLGRLGRYEIERLIGSGGMGIVFKAFDTELNRPVAIKLLAPYLSANGSARKRFAREARAAAGVVDDHVVPIFNVESESEPAFLVMQYIAGGSLQESLDRNGPLEVSEILRIGLQTAKGLAAAHAQGLIHRDVKPSNILLDEGVERALLTDFGLARTENDASLTRSGFHLGTPHYMSPEQVRGEAIDGRSDLFGLGCVMYALCTGHPPFRAGTSFAVMRRITDDQPRPIREVNANVPEWLERIVMWMLAKSPDERYQSAEEAAELLERCLAHVQQPTMVDLPSSLVTLHLRESDSLGRRGLSPVATASELPTSGKVKIGFHSQPPWKKLLVALAFAVPLLLAAIFITIETGKGTIRIETNEDINVPIRITQGDKTVQELTVTKAGTITRLKAGKYTIEIDDPNTSLSITGGNVELKRGRDWVARIERQKLTGEHPSEVSPAESVNRASIENSPESAREPANEGDAKLLISDVVRVFNREQQQDPIGKTQPPLTDDELIAAMRSVLRRSDDVSAEQKGLLRAVEAGYMPFGWRVKSSNKFQLGDGRKGTCWIVQLSIDINKDANVKFPLRKRYINVEPIKTVRPMPVGNTSIADWVAKLNEPDEAVYLPIPDAPVTEHEIIAALAHTADQLDPTESAGQRDALQEIIATRSIRPKAEFTLFRPKRHVSYRSRWTSQKGNADESQWSLHIKYPYQRGGEEIVTGAILGERIIDARSLDYVTDDEIKWGPTDDDGLQLGVAIEMETPEDAKSASERRYKPHFYFRNKLAMDEMTFVSFPDYVQYYDLIATTPTGETLPTRQRQGHFGISTPLVPDQLTVHSRIHRHGSSFLIGVYEEKYFEESLLLEPAETLLFMSQLTHAINAPAGTPIRIRIAVPHPFQSDAEPLLSGEIRLPRLKPSNAAEGNDQASVTRQPRESVAPHVGPTTTQFPVDLVASSAGGKTILIADGSPTRSQQDWRPKVQVLRENQQGVLGWNLAVVSAEEIALLHHVSQLASLSHLSRCEVTAIALSPDERVVAVGTNVGQVKFLSTDDGKLIRTLIDEDAQLAKGWATDAWRALKLCMGRVNALAFTPDGRKLIVGGESYDDIPRPVTFQSEFRRRQTGPGRLRVWDVASGNLDYDLIGHSSCSSVAVTPDGQYFLSAGNWSDASEDGTGVIVWDTDSGEQVRKILVDSNGGTRRVAVSPDGKHIAVGSLSFARDVVLEEELKVGSLSLHLVSSGAMSWQVKKAGAITSICFAPEGKQIAALWGRDNDVRLFDTDSGREADDTGWSGGKPHGMPRWSMYVDRVTGNRMPQTIASNIQGLLMGGADDDDRGFLALASFTDWNKDKSAPSSITTDVVFPAKQATVETKVAGGRSRLPEVYMPGSHDFAYNRGVIKEILDNWEVIVSFEKPDSIRLGDRLIVSRPQPDIDQYENFAWIEIVEVVSVSEGLALARVDQTRRIQDSHGFEWMPLKPGDQVALPHKKPPATSKKLTPELTNSHATTADIVIPVRQTPVETLLWNIAGATFKPVLEHEIKSPGWKGGLRITNLRETGPAEEAKMRLGDIIVAINSIPIDSLGAIDLLWRRAEYGKPMKVNFIREGEVVVARMKWDQRRLGDTALARGKVLRRRGDRVEVSLGTKDGVYPGDRLIADTNYLPLAELEVITAAANWSDARVVSEYEGLSVQVGDAVAYGLMKLLQPPPASETDRRFRPSDASRGSMLLPLRAHRVQEGLEAQLDGAPKSRDEKVNSHSEIKGLPGALGQQHERFLDGLQGDWLITRCVDDEGNGLDRFDGQHATIRVDGKLLTIRGKVGGRSFRMPMGLKLVGAETPQAVDLLNDPNNTESLCLQRGIIEWRNDQLQLCCTSECNPPESGRPKFFAAGAKSWLIEARRILKPDAPPAQDAASTVGSRHSETCPFCTPATPTIRQQLEANADWLPDSAATKELGRYVASVRELSEDTAKRLAFYLQHLENSDPLIAEDAVKEIGLALHESVITSDELDPVQLLRWVQDEHVEATRKRTYLRLLAIGGTKDVGDSLERMIREQRQKHVSCMDAIISSYISLRGPAGLYLVDKLLLNNSELADTDVYPVIPALRFQLSHGKSVDRDRLLESLHLILERPQLADLVIEDLTAQKDWSQVEKVAALLKYDAAKNKWLRVPCLRYLGSCPLPQAKIELSRLDLADSDADVSEHHTATDRNAELRSSRHIDLKVKSLSENRLPSPRLRGEGLGVRGFRTGSKGEQSTWEYARPSKIGLSEGNATISSDGWVQLQGNTTWQKVSLSFKQTAPKEIRQIRLELSPEGASVEPELKGVNRKSCKLFEATAAIENRDGKTLDLPFSNCRSPARPDDESTANCIDSLTDTGWTLPILPAPNQLVFSLQESVTVARGETLTVTIDCGGSKDLDVLSRVRVSLDSSQD